MKNYWLRSGVLTLLQKMATVLFGFGSFYVLVRILDKSEFGTWSLFITITTLFETIRNGLVQNSMVKFLATASEADKPKIISASFTISGSLTIICIILNLLCAQYLSNLWDSPELVYMFHLYSLVYIITYILTQFQFIEQANFQFLGIFLSTVVRQGTLFFYVLGAFIFDYTIILSDLVLVQVIGAMCGTITLFGRVRKIIRQMSLRFESEWVVKLLNFGKYSFGTSVSSVIFNSINQAMLGGMISTIATASYNIAVRITNLVEIPTSSVASIVFPQSAKRMEAEGKLAVKLLYEKSVAAILAVLLPGLIFMFIFSEWIVDFVAGERYEESVPLLNITLFTCLLIPFGRQFGTLLDSIGKPRITFLNVLLSAVVNIVLNYFFIKHMGVIGAAYATLLAGIFGFIISQRILKKELNVSLLNTLIYTKNFYIEFYRKYIRSH